MAVLWQQVREGKHHEVRSAGHSRRLYTDKVFHSQFNPRHPAGGHIWDLLMLPALFVDTATVRRILVLGAGGGAVMRQLDYFLTPDLIIGIDNNPLHLDVAQRFFGVNGHPYQLQEADALNWISSYSGLPFDMIIDDLYGEHHGQPCRAVTPDLQWFASIQRLLSPAGIFVVNFMSSSDLRRSAWYTSKQTRRLFKSGFRLTMQRYENVIGVFGRMNLDAKTLRKQVMSYPELDPRRKATKLQYSLRKLN